MEHEEAVEVRSSGYIDTHRVSYQSRSRMEGNSHFTNPGFMVLVFPSAVPFLKAVILQLAQGLYGNT